MTPPRAADDFEIIRARMEELRRERKRVAEAETGKPGEVQGRRVDRICPIGIEIRRDAAG